MIGGLGFLPTRLTDFDTFERQQILPRLDAFGPRQHLEALHPENGLGGARRGVISFAQRSLDRDRTWKEWTISAGGAAIDEAERLLRADSISDIYVSQAAFQRWRSISQLAAIGACYSDLDYHNTVRWRAMKAKDVASAVIVHLEEAMLPLPSYILSTGRGLLCVWLTELLPRVALPRWTAVQKRLGQSLEPFGADKRALDAARVFRLVGSRNSSADRDRQTVGMVWFQGTPELPTRHVFESLADEVLPFTQAELVSLRAERAKRTAAVANGKSPTTHLTAESYWESVLTDLQRLRAHRQPNGGLPPGQRDTWLFVAGVAVSWISPPEVLVREIHALAFEAAGWNESEVRSRMSSVVKRAQRAAAGEKISFGNRDVDCRYRMKVDTMVEWLGIDPTEQRAAGLRLLVDKDRRRELNTQRTKDSRRRRGVADRCEQQATRLAMGQEALYLRASKGMTRNEMAQHFHVSTRQIAKAIHEALGCSDNHGQDQ